MAQGGRVALWLFWFLSTASGVLFVILGLVVFADLAQVQHEPTAGDLSSQLNGVLAATLMGSVFVALLTIVSFMILVRKTWAKSGTGFSYGFLSSSYLWACFFLILTGVDLTANKHWTPTFEQSVYWSSSSTGAYIGAYVLAFLTAGFYLCMFGVMIGPGRHAVRGQVTVDELGLSERLRTGPGSVSMAAPPASPLAAPGPRGTGGGAWSSSA